MHLDIRIMKIIFLLLFLPLLFLQSALSSKLKPGSVDLVEYSSTESVLDTTPLKDDELLTETIKPLLSTTDLSDKRPKKVFPDNSPIRLRYVNPPTNLPTTGGRIFTTDSPKQSKYLPRAPETSVTDLPIGTSIIPVTDPSTEQPTTEEPTTLTLCDDENATITILSMTSTASSITILWTSSLDASCLKGVSITIIQKDSGDPDIIFSPKKEIEISDLIPCTQYGLNVELVLASPKKTQKSSFLEISTKAEVAEFNIYEIDPSSRNATVTLQQIGNNNCKHHFQYILKHKDEIVYIDITEFKEFSLSKLIPCTEYTLTMNPVIVDGSAKRISGSKVNQDFKTGYEMVTISNLVVIEETTNATVTFNKDGENNCPHFYQYNLTNTITHSSQSYTSKVTSQFIPKLFACSTYDLKVWPKMNIDNEDPEDGVALWKRFTTHYDAPSAVTSFVATHFSADSIIVNWEPPEQNFYCGESYVLKWNDVADNDKPIGNATIDRSVPSAYKIQDLEACKNYSVEIQIKDVKNGLLEKKTLQSETDQGEPGPVENLEIIPIKNILYISWIPPKVAQFCVVNYAIEIIETDTSCTEVTVSKSSKQNILTGYENINQCNTKLPVLDNILASDCIDNKCSIEKSLKSCTQYEVTVVANGIISGEGVSKSSTTEYSEPGPVQDLQVEATSYETIKVEWKPPDKNENCLKNYHIMWRTKTGELINETILELTEKSFDIGGLEGCTDYTVTVSVIGKLDGSPVNSEYKTVETKEIAPKEQLEYEVDSTASTIFLKWEPPKHHAACVIKYRIGVNSIQEGEPNIFDGETTDTSILIDTSLRACRTYNITLTPVIKGDDEDQMTIIPTETKKLVAAPPGLKLVNDELKPESIKFTARVMDKQTNGCKLKKVVVTCKADDKQFEWQIEEAEGSTKIHRGPADDLIVTVDKVSAFTKYTCAAVLVNEAGTSEPSDDEVVKTPEDVPDKPTNGTWESSYKTISMFWEEPNKIPGELEPYELTITLENTLYTKSCTCASPDGIMYNYTTTNTQYVFETGIYPYSSYNIEVRAKTKAGLGEPLAETVHTLPKEPEPVENLAVYEFNRDDLTYENVSAIVKWKQPCRFNGIFSRYKINGLGKRDGFPVHEFAEHFIESDSCYTSYMFDKLKPEFHYVFEVSSEMLTKDGKLDDYNVKSTTRLETPAGIPPEFSSDITISPPEPYETADSTRMAKIEIPQAMFNNEMGNIKHVAIILAQKECAEFRINNGGLGWPISPTWEDVQDKDCIPAYQTTPMDWDPFKGLKSSKESNIAYVIGEDDCSTVKGYCNGPLRPGTGYYVVIRAITATGFRDTNYHDIQFFTAAEIALGVILGSIFAIICAGFAVVMYMYYRKRNIPWLKKSIESQSSPTPLPVPVKNVSQYVTQLTDNPGKLSNEFQLLGTLSVDLPFSSSVAKLPVNKRKNRYVNILPFDETRVKLLCDEFASDYINASLIRGYSDKVEYIATQGPTEDTVVDFWRMVMQYDASLIVMLTQLTEDGKVKCHQYYPGFKETIQVQEIAVHCSLEIAYDSYISRTFIIQNETHHKTITQLHFTEWNDFGCPDSTHVILQFCETMRQQCNNNNELIHGPIIIHCSAGVGRTGTLIALDILIQYIKDNRKIDVFGTVLNLRKQRVKMVQSEAQYKYVYQCIKDAVGDPSLFLTKDNLNSGSREPIYENMEVFRSSGLTGSNGSLKIQSESCM